MQCHNSQPNNQNQQQSQHNPIQIQEFNPQTQINNLFQSMSKHIQHLPTFVKRKLYHYKNNINTREGEQLISSQRQIDMFQCFKIKLAIKLNRSSLLLRGTRMNLGIRLSKIQAIQEEQKEIQINVEIQKIANYVISLGEYIKLIYEQKYFDVGYPTIHQNFIVSVIEFASFILSEYQAEIFFNKEANQLIKAILWTIDVYLSYKTTKGRIYQTKKDIQKRLKRKCKRSNSKKSEIKQQKFRQKNKDIEINNNIIKIQDDEQNEDVEIKEGQKNGRNRIVIKKQKRIKKTGQKMRHTLKKNASQINLLDNQKISHTNNKNNGKKPKDAKINFTIQEKTQSFIKNVLTNANKGVNSLLQNQTFQFIVYFISRHMPVNILQGPPYKKFNLKLIDLLQQLLKVKINGQKIPGYHFLLSKIGLQLLEDSHLRINYEISIKRYIFEHLQKDLKLRTFYQYLKKNYQQLPLSTGNLVEIVQKQADKSDDQLVRYNFNNQKCLQLLKKQHHEKYIIKLKQGIEMHLINQKLGQQKKKSSNHEQNNKGIKISDYVPDGDIYHFINQLIQRAISLLFEQIDSSISSSQQNNDQNKESSLCAFNIKNLLQTLQFLIRQSPIFCPFVAKFKCKKIILGELAKSDKYKNIQELNRIIMKLLIVKKQQMNQSIPQIGFLSVVIRLFSPFILNSVSGIVFQICLDNIPLVQSNNKSNFSSFGSVARLKALQQFDNILFSNNNSENIFRKLCLLNLISVMLHMKQMAKLFIENNFINKIYKLYIFITNKMYQNQDTSTRLFKRLYLKKIILPFYLTPLEILQEININIQSTKKNKHKNKQASINSVLNIEAINAQLCPRQYLQRYYFKKDWPFNEQELEKKNIQEHQNEEQNQNADQFSNQSSQQSNSQQSFSEHSSDEFDRSIQNNDIQEGQQIHGEDGHLLNMQWDFSNSFNENNMHQYPNQDDPVIEDYSNSDMLIEQISDEEQDMQQIQQMDQQQIDDDIQHQQGDEDLNNDSIDFIQSFNSAQHNQFLHRNDVDMHLRFNQEELYDNIYNIVNFQDIQSLSRISKVQGQQIHNLRLLLRLQVFPKRQCNMNTLPQEEAKKRQNYARQKSCLLITLKEDDIFKIVQYVENRQILRYDQLANEQPKASIELEQIYSDRQFLDNQRRIRGRRNGILNIERHINFSDVMPGWNFMRQEQNISSLSQESQLMRNGRVRHQSQENPPPSEIQPHEQRSIAIVPPPIQLSPAHRPISAIEQVENGPIRMPQIVFRFPQNHENQQNQRLQTFRSSQITPVNMMIEGFNRNQIERIININNLSMTVDDFRRLSTEVQQAIIFNAGSVQEQRLHQRLVAVQSESQQIQDQGGQNNQRSDSSSAERMQQEVYIRNDDGMINIPPQDESSSQSSNQYNIQGAVVDDYRRISLNYIKILNKDAIEISNRDGKNDSKYYELQQTQFQRLIQMLYIMDEKQHLKLPYPLFQTLCINKNNLQKLISILFVLLQLTPSKIQQLKYQIHPIIALNLLEQSTQIWKQYSNKTYSIVSLKILHVLKHLTNIYSISMNFFKINNRYLSSFTNFVNPTQNQYTSFELMFELLTIEHLSTSATHLEFITSILDNITVHHFYKFIHLLTNTTIQDQIKTQHLKLIKIKEKSGQLIGSLLENVLIKQKVAVVSRIIMRLCVHEQNIDFFIKYISMLVHKLSIQALQQLQKFKIQQNTQCHFKIVNLMYIFIEMVKAYKTYPATTEKHQSVLASFRKIIQYEQLHKLCEQSIRNLFEPQNPFQSKYGQIVDCFFILLQIVKLTSNKIYAQKNEENNHIAELDQMKVSNNELVKADHQDIILKDFNLTVLWKEAIVNANFKTYLNSNIKNKITTANKRFQHVNSGFLDIPILKIAALHPQILTFQNKLKIFKAQVKKYKGKAKYQVISIPLSREEVFQESFDKIMACNAQALKGKIKIQFLGEEGQDAGGLARQWFQLLSRQMFNPNYGLFKQGSGGHTYHPSSMSYVNNQHLDYFKFIGRITGKALLDGYLLDAYFTPAFYKHILNLPIKFEDMQEEDYQFYKSLTWILQNKPIEQYLQLNFTYQCDHFGQIQTKQLLPGGSDILVTEQNKMKYVQLLSYAKMATNIKTQLQSFLTGLHQLMPHRFLRIFNQKQLQIMISGRPTIDIQDLKNNTEYVNYTKDDQIIKWLFQLLQSYDMEMRTSFIQFVTGSSRIPAQGFKDLRGMNGVQKFNIHKEFQDQSLPRAHTCFNQLDLPNYKTRQMLIQKLTYAITQGKQGFGII